MARRTGPPVMVGAIIDRVSHGVIETLIAKIPTPPYEGCWTFPNGPADPGEAPESALRRMLHATLGVNLRIICGQPPIDLPWDDVLCRWRFFFCDATDSEVATRYYSEVRWVRRPDFREYDFDPVSQQVAAWLLDDLPQE
ncbi:MAG: NUDIX domain-containing protein [Phycisphaerae bacterium]|nr:NUDIX domain-containing protein [Phycisphaerae bacterium]